MKQTDAQVSSLLIFLLLFLLEPWISVKTMAQELHVQDPYLEINARMFDPVYTTYTAAMSRSQLYGDKGYTLTYDDPEKPLSMTGDQAGSLYTVFMDNQVVFDKVSDFYMPPVMTASFPDMAILTYSLMPNVDVQQTFFVYSSSLAVTQLVISNHSDDDHIIHIYPMLYMGMDHLHVLDADTTRNAIITRHHETGKRLISNLYASAPYPKETRDILALDKKMYSYGSYQGGLGEFYNEIKTDWYSSSRSDSLNLLATGDADFVAIQCKVTLAPGQTQVIRYFRGWQDLDEDAEQVYRQINELKGVSLQGFVDDNIKLFGHIPRIDFQRNEEKMVYLGAFNLLRGCMLPPTGETKYNFYVFSRNPLWGWGHGHQVQHESLAMMAYALLDPASAEASQRVYMEQQGKDGLIPYRVGPRGPQTYPHKGEPTTSSPFFSWTNLEIYKINKDKQFLADAYAAGMKYLDWLKKNRDTDKDGLFEWGPYGLIENVRDWYNVIFQVSAERHLDIDKEDISDELEDLDLTLMVINEARSLEVMARDLDRERDAKRLHNFAENTIRLVNKTMWDPETGFYYHVDKKNHRFQFMTRDLKREEIIGFLPLWAEAANPEQAGILMDKLTDPAKFWRKYGVPTLSADDPYYSPYVDYCCKWNGPVWLLWDYMVFRGMINYGYKSQAGQLARKMMDAVTIQLSRNHHYWESYSPDNTTLNCPPNYIWDGIMARLLKDVYDDPEILTGYRLSDD